MTVGVVMFLAGAAFFAASVFLLYGIKKTAFRNDRGA